MIFAHLAAGYLCFENYFNVRLVLSKGTPLRSSMPITQNPMALEVKPVCVSSSYHSTEIYFLFFYNLKILMELLFWSVF